MAVETIVSGETITLSSPLTGNILFLNVPAPSGDLVIEPTAFVVSTVTVSGTLTIGSVSLGGTVEDVVPGDVVNLGTLDADYAALDVAANAATENARFDNDFKFSAQSGVQYFVEDDGTVKPSVNSPLTAVDANTQTILDELVSGIFGPGAAAVTVTIAPYLAVTTGSETSVTDAVLTVSADIIPCFAAGTRVLTSAGEIPVEKLVTGDRVINIAGEDKAIVWIGRRALDLVRHARPDAARPVIVEPGALGEDVPTRRLIVSPDHAFYLEGVLVPAKALVNGATIRPDMAARSVLYFHVELAKHDVIFAEGAAVESFLDTGHRGLFENGGAPLLLHPDLMEIRRAREGYAPLVTGGARLEAIRASQARRLLRRQG